MPHLLNCSCISAGTLTLGMTTELSALGASRGACERSPPGWYLYFPRVSESQGLPAWVTGDSEVELVGERPRMSCNG